MDIFQSLVLGIIQGFTEFLPISSSAHLWLIPKIFGWTSPTTTYILFIQLGTLLALVIYYRNLIIGYIKSLWKFLKNKSAVKKDDNDNLKVIRNIIIATIPAGVIGFFLDSRIEALYDAKENERVAIIVTLVTLSLVGLLFIFSGRIFTRKKSELEKLSVKGALIIGFSQSIALLRGVSRSGITLLSGQAIGLKRFSAAEFSFLISMPILLASSLYGIYNFFKLPQAQIQQELLPSLAGMFAAFVFGLIAIRFLLKFLKTNSLVSFGVYRIIFAIIIGVILLG